MWRLLGLLGYPDVYAAADHLPDVLAHKPTGLEGVDDILVGNLRQKGLHVEDLHLLPEGRGWLLAELGADTREELDQQVEGLTRALKKSSNQPSIRVLRKGVTH